jgi:hypothetical protein
VIRADAHGDAPGLALVHQGAEALLDALQLGRVLGVRVLAHGEALAVGEVAGVDPHLLHVVGRFHRRRRVEVDVRHQGDADAFLAQDAPDGAQVTGVFHRRGGDAHDLAAGLHQALGLGDGGVRVHRIRRGHGLDAEGIGAADADLADGDGAGGAPPVAVGVGGIPPEEQASRVGRRGANGGGERRDDGSTHRWLMTAVPGSGI